MNSNQHFPLVANPSEFKSIEELLIAATSGHIILLGGLCHLAHTTGDNFQ